MWAFIYSLGSPKLFYEWSGRHLPWVSTLMIITLSTGLIWGLFFTPPDYQQGDAFRIIYLHVPAAFLSLSLYAVMAFLAILLLVWQIKLAGLMIGVVARIGAIMAVLALVTGSIWGKPMWGAWWVWDARLTSELVLFLLYAAILGSLSSFANPNQGEKLVAILTLVGLIDLPIIHYSVYWWNSLHQGQTLSLLAKPKIAPVMLYPLLLTLVGFSLYALVSVLWLGRARVLARDRHKAWVKEV